MVAPTDAEALGIRAGLQGKIGGANATSDEFAEDPDLALAYGGNVYGTIAIIPKLYFGLYFDFTRATHPVGDSDASLIVNLPGAGGVFRTSWFGFTGQLYGGYAFGSTQFELDGVEGESTRAYGPQFGLFLAKEFVIVPAVTSIDAGLFGWWQNLHGEEINGIEPEAISYFTFGLGIQVNLGLGF